ncbi:MAG: alpha/beta hydrolase [Chitinophagaceae bacterium]|nr:alpha/beta hydrolase [Chitinophagaceae bacterium]
MQSLFVTYKRSRIHYIRVEGGNELLVCLHGFGETAESFLPLIQALKNQYTIVAIDLPFHGKSVWKEGLSVTINDMAAIIDEIPVLQQKVFSLMGYSMGGRVALHVYQHIPERIKQLILPAPDGLKINGWYRLATQSKAGNRLFHYFMRRPGLFFWGTGLLNKIHLINRGVYNYVYQYLRQETKREALYTIWTAMRNIRPDVRLIKAQIQKHQTQVILIYGAYDRIIRFTTGNAFIKGLEAYCTLHVLPCGHRLLHEKNTTAIAALLLNLQA